MGVARRKLLGAGLLVAINILILLAVEGLASYYLLARSLGAMQPVDVNEVNERRHTRYDPDLGWVNLPNLRYDDMYRAGVRFETNARGFRNAVETSVSVPDGMHRVICSGDSFTLGFGVANEDAWCHRLAALAPDRETVNMGQGGYGVDQSFLWYRRDGLRIDHDVHVFAFVTPDLVRMRMADFQGYGKPLLRVVDGGLRVDNVPVPETFFRWPRVELQVARFLGNGHRFVAARIHERLERGARVPANAPPGT